MTKFEVSESFEVMSLKNTKKSEFWGYVIKWQKLIKNFEVI